MTAASPPGQSSLPHHDRAVESDECFPASKSALVKHEQGSLLTSPEKPNTTATPMSPRALSPSMLEPAHVQHPAYDGRPGTLHDRAWEGTTSSSKTGELSSHLMEAIGLREQYEHLRVESGRRRQALEWLLRTRDSVPGAYSINLRSHSVPTSPRPHGRDEFPGDTAVFASIAEPDIVVPSTGPRNWDKGEFWPVKGRDVPKLMEAISSLAHTEGTAAVRLQDQEVCASWNLANATKKLAEERIHPVSGPQLVPRRVLVESPWLKFGEFSRVAFRVYPHGDGTAQPGNATVFVWMAHPPGLSFTFNLRIEDTLSTAPRLWQATMIHYRMDLRWCQLSQALKNNDYNSLKMVLQVLQWHGPEDDPADSKVEHHTSISLALEMLQSAANKSPSSARSTPSLRSPDRLLPSWT